MKPIKRMYAFDSFKDLCGSQNKRNILICVKPNTNKMNWKLGPLEVLPETMVISFDGENDNSFLSKKCNYGSKTTNRRIMLINRKVCS